MNVTDFSIITLECGHEQHVRHKPPLVERSWVLTAEGRAGMIGATLDCRACDVATDDEPHPLQDR